MYGMLRVEPAHPAHAVLDLGDDLGLAVELLDPEVPPELVDDRQERDRLAERDAPPLEPGRSSPRLGQPPPELEEEPRLPDAGLARHEHDLAAPGLHLAEQLEQHVQLARRGRPAA